MRALNPDDQPLPEWLETAYVALEAYISKRDDGVSPAEAQEVLLEVTAEELRLTPAEAEHAIQRLLDRGYLYAVDDTLFVTDTDEEA